MLILSALAHGATVFHLIVRTSSEYTFVAAPLNLSFAVSLTRMHVVLILGEEPFIFVTFKVTVQFCLYISGNSILHSLNFTICTKHY